MVSEVVVVVGGCGIVCGDSCRSVLEMVMPKGNGKGGLSRKRPPKGSANKRKVVNAGSDSSRTRMRGAKNVEANRKKVAEMKAKKRQRGGGGSRGY